MIITLADLAAAFRKVYGLSEGNGLDALRHDALHGITGLGIGGANELRLNFIIDALSDRSMMDAKRDHDYRLRIYINAFKRKNLNPLGLSNADDGRYETGKVHFAQSHMTALTQAEMSAFYDLGLEMREKLESITGKPYFETAPEILANIDATAVNFTDQAQGIKDQFRTAQNRRVERMSVNIMTARAIELDGVSYIPQETGLPAPQPKTMQDAKPS